MSLRSHLYFFFRIPVPKLPPPPCDRHMHAAVAKIHRDGFHSTSSLNQDFSQHFRHQYKGTRPLRRAEGREEGGGMKGNS